MAGSIKKPPDDGVATIFGSCGCWFCYGFKFSILANFLQSCSSCAFVSFVVKVLGFPDYGDDVRFRRFRTCPEKALTLSVWLAARS